ncbi:MULTISPECIES: hypothetical protein [Streptomyces]|uniref:Uncharacterized protein n=1 Tax=Streptomyces clavifer TaxID=68188 RepID=A0ABS4VI63_9ACTN|nr:MULTISPECIES: hypothetical protein [Streptomyces]MBP2363612.1 hypothetical protein [Streptomyces clavifer]MDX2748076.1 hypothetical protein [Streptomyces sp. NRRL_B-2557]
MPVVAETLQERADPVDVRGEHDLPEALALQAGTRGGDYGVLGPGGHSARPRPVTRSVATLKSLSARA